MNTPRRFLFGGLKAFTLRAFADCLDNP